MGGTVLGCLAQGCSCLSKVQRSHQGILKPKSSTNGVPCLPGAGLPQYSCCTVMTRRSLWEGWPGHSSVGHCTAQQLGPLVRDAPSSHRSGRHILTGVTVHPLGLHRSPSPHSFWDQCFLVPAGPSSQGETNKGGQRDQLQPLSL